MAQIFMNSNGFILEILEDGVHPGTKVVESGVWNSRPKEGFQCIHIPGVPRKDFMILQQLKPLPDQVPNFAEVRRQRILNLSPQHRGELRTERTLVITEAELLTRENPN